MSSWHPPLDVSLPSAGPALALNCGVVFGLLSATALYARGTLRVWRRSGQFQGIRLWQVNCYGAAVVTLLLTLVSPLDPLSDRLFVAHMAQHELLMLVAAPLLVAGRPLVPMLWALPRASRETLGQWLGRPLPRRAWRALSHPLLVLVVQALVIWLWHIPAWFQAALANEWLHAVQHAMFFGVASLFWWSLIHGRYGRSGYGVSVIFVFATAVHTSILGAALALAQRVWYPQQTSPVAPFALTPLEDQALAGLFMWVPSGFIFVGIGLALCAAWLGEAARRHRTPRGS